jgi:transketolase
MSAPYSDIDHLSINTIRVLAADMVGKANSGHPGMPMGMAPVAHVLWSRIMKYDSTDPKWPNKDRFILSNGHGCALQYVLLHLTGADLSMDDLKSFRQFGAKTAGHPESHLIPNLEVTTGPLGQGLSNSVGLAVAERHAASIYNKPDVTIVDNFTYVFCGDGCLQEGVSSEASSLAGHWGLGKLILIYDDNKITIDGKTSLSFTEDVLKRYEAYGWHTSVVADGNADLQGIEDAIRAAQAVQDRPSIIALKTIIGFLSKEQGSHEVHGSPLKPDDLKEIKKKLGFNPDVSFHVPEEVYKYWADVSSKGKHANRAWATTMEEYSKKYPELAAQLNRTFMKKLPDGWKEKIPTFPKGSKADATRNLSGVVLNALADAIPELVGGSADLTPSNKTALKKGGGDFQKDNHGGRYFRFGVREHGMFAIANGIAAYGCFIPFTATFMNFITYGWGAARLSALSNVRQIFIMTHDSIGLGEDGPTHQPVEVAALIRATPNMYCFRPADGNEVAGAYMFAIEHDHSPSVLCLSRQNCPTLELSSPEAVLKGAYIVEESKSSPDVVLISTGSEVGIALEAARTVGDLNIRVVSAPCLELFDLQSKDYRRSILPIGVPVVSFEAQGISGWSRYAHHSIGIKAWGTSAPYERIYEEYGLTAPKINIQIKEFLEVARPLGFGPLPIHY